MGNLYDRLLIFCNSVMDVVRIAMRPTFLWLSSSPTLIRKEWNTHIKRIRSTVYRIEVQDASWCDAHVAAHSAALRYCFVESGSRSPKQHIKVHAPRMHVHRSS